MATPEKNEVVVRRFYTEAWNQQKLEILDETHHPNWTHRDPSNPQDLGGGPEGNRVRLKELMQAFPDIHYTLDDVIAAGDRVVVRFTVTGTHRGTFAGIPQTGKRVAMPGIIIHRLDEGKIIEDWVVRDTLGLLRQLGVFPAPGQ